ncbi:pilus assembly protein FimV [Pseudomonas sp. TE3786]
MVQVRHLLLGLASGSALYSGMVSALGLGDITLHSALNQPLEADIELLEVGDLGAADMKVRLASDAVYARSGVDRIIFLNDLRFTPLLGGGKSVIRVVSSKPVREPYLNFIVELARPNGQLYREYTVLLDPPNASAYNRVAAAPAAASSAASGKSRAAAAPAKPRTPPPAKLGKHYQVSNGDSVWTIAARLRTQGSTASQEQLMADIHALNPQAFGGNDISRLQAGANLLLPDAAPVAAVPGSAADAEPPATLSVVDDEAPPVPAPLETQAELIAQLQKRLDNELAQNADENTKLQQSLANLEVQVQQLMQQSVSKDQQIADLRAQLDAQPAASAPVAQPMAADSTAAVPAAENRSWFGAIWGLLGLLVAGLIGLLLWRRTREKPQPSSFAPIASVAVVTEDADRFELDDIVTPPVVAAPLVSAPRAPVAVTLAEPRPASPTDTLEGANIYIAYGRFSEAAGSLRRALDAEPQRSDIRFRLLEVLAQLGDARGFQREEELLLDAGYADSAISQLKARHPDLFAVAQDLEPELDLDALDDAVLVLDDAAPLASQPLAEDDQFNLDDFSLDPDWDLISPFSANARNKAEAAQKASNEADAPHIDLGKTSDVGSPFAGSAMLVEETHDEGWFGEGLDDEAYLSQPVVEEGEPLGDLDHLEARRDNLAKFNQALAYIEQGHLESACDILNELINEGDEAQKLEASKLLAKIA